MENNIYGSGLSILTNKCAPNVFDISSRMQHASIRDQVVRGQLLVRDLARHDEKFERVLIVGAGVAGITAGIAASHLGKKVLVIDTQKKPFSLQSSVTTRYVGPFMYEWPNITFESQNYPLDPDFSLLEEVVVGSPEWQSDSPMRASELVHHLENWLRNKAFGSPPPLFWFNVDPSLIRHYIKEFVWLAKENHKRRSRKKPEVPQDKFFSGQGCINLDGNAISPRSYFIPDYIILACGMGQENVKLKRRISGKQFWDNDDIRQPRSRSKRICIFGGGDGAMQDALRAITDFDHPLHFIKHMEKNSAVRNAFEDKKPLLELLEQQSRLVNTWMSGSTHGLIDNRCSEIAKKLATLSFVRKQVVSGLRKTRLTGKAKKACFVHHFVRENYFGKAYLLNRFCLHLIRHCLERKSMETINHKSHYQLHFNSTVAQERKRCGMRHPHIVSMSERNRKKRFVFDIPIIRHGVNGSTIPAEQIVALSSRNKKDRISMAGIPQPFVVP